MDTKQVYSNKAEKYARFRWDYASQAIESIFAISRLGQDASVADIGAGTGILTRHFMGRVQNVYAIEPNPEMRQQLEAELAGCGTCSVLAGSAEATGLIDHSVELITVAQAIHWFNAEQTRKEFRRILKPGGWLAILRNLSTQDDINQATSELHRAEYGFEGVQAARRMEWKPLIYYYGNGRFRRIRFPFAFEQDWERFFGALLSTAGMPDESHSRYKYLEGAARDVFARFSVGGKMEVRGETELFIGQVTGID
jgi:ubiquinone/menaquinone biosynthesis C-methylase UbiE